MRGIGTNGKPLIPIKERQSATADKGKKKPYKKATVTPKTVKAILNFYKS